MNLCHPHNPPFGTLAVLMDESRYCCLHCCCCCCSHIGSLQNLDATPRVLPVCEQVREPTWGKTVAGNNCRFDPNPDALQPVLVPQKCQHDMRLMMSFYDDNDVQGRYNDSPHRRHRHRHRGDDDAAA